MKTKKILLELFSASLVILFVYTASIKLIKFEENALAMKAQPLVHWLQNLLIFGVPFSEIIAVALIAVPKWRRIGLYTTLGLLLCFTGYVVLVNLNYYGRIPCSCGGVIGSLTWQEHLVFNSFFIIICISAIFLDRHITNRENQSSEVKFSNG